MHPTTGSDTGDGPSVHRIVEDLLGERIEALAGWIQELDAKVRATSAAGDEKTLKELRRALDAWAKRDPKFEDRLTDRVDVLADRLATLSSAVNTTAAAHAGSDGDIAALRRELEQAAVKVESALSELRPASVAKEVEELRRTVAALSAEPLSRKGGDKRVDGLSEKVDNLGERLDTLAKTVATTAAGLAGREGELAGLRRMLETGNARVEAMIANLRQEDLSPVAELEERLATLARTVATATKSLAGREGEIAALRARLDEGNAKVGAVVAALRQSVDVLANQLAAVDAAASDTDAVEGLGRRVESLGAEVDKLGTQLDSVVTAVETASEGQERDLAALQRRFEDAGSRVDTVLGELRQTLEALPKTASVDPELDARVERVAADVGALTRRLEEAESASSERSAQGVSQAADLERRVAEVAQRLADAERARDVTAAEIARAACAWAEEQTWVREQLDALVIAASETRAADDVEPRLRELATRLHELEREREAAAADLDRISETWADERTWVREQLDALVTVVADMHAAGAGEEMLEALMKRVDTVERDRETVVAEAGRVRTEWAAERDALEARLDELAAAFAQPAWSSESGVPGPHPVEIVDRLDALERDSAVVASEIARTGAFWAAELDALEARLEDVRSERADAGRADDEELERLLVAFADRIEEMETDRTSLTARVDDVASQLGALESARREPSPAQASQVEGEQLAAISEPPTGDGRFRVEVRALELRLEHLEAAERENREAVLVQLERLASRVEWRLQRLESDENDTGYPQPATRRSVGQVVPIRGGAET